MKIGLVLALTLTLGLSPSATSQTASPHYKRLEIKRFACQSIPADSSDGNGCLSQTDPGKIVWNFPACNWQGTGGADSSCVVRATSNKTGALRDIKATCSEKRFERVARQCLGAHAVKQEFRSDGSPPVCVSIDYKRDGPRTNLRREPRAPEGIIIRELETCPVE